MKTAKLLFKIMVCLLPLWCVMGYIAFFPQSYGNQMTAYNLWHKKICRSKELKNYNTIVLGDSVANAAYVPDYISEDFINLSLPQSTPIENYFILKEILKIHKPSTIFISFMNHHLNGYMNGLFDERMFSHRFDFKTEATIMNYARKSRDIAKIFPPRHRRYLHDWVLHRLYLPPVFMPSLLNSNLNDRKKDNDEFVKSLELHRGTFTSRSQRENVDNKRIDYTAYYISSLQKKFYKRILKLCNEQNIKVKIVILPLSPKIRFSENYIRQRKEVYEELESEFPNVEVVFPFINLRPIDFMDTHHLNVHGSFKFSVALRNRYKDIFPPSATAPLSERTINGREDYLRLENEYTTLLERIEDPFYAIIFNPKGDLAERIKRGDMNRKGIHSYKYDNLFLLNNDTLDDVSLNAEKQYVEFSLGKQKREIGKTQLADIHIVIVNKIKNEVVTEKRYVLKNNGLLEIN
ncbi:MAG: hypothetical protein J5716_08740 [Alphaproteobacteria bacterium]|nr:hypothetical protein [Alphaproteobacteria bacterium]